LPPRLYFNYAESLYVTFLLRGGIILLFVYLGLMASLALRARRIARGDDSEQRVVARVVLAAVPLLMVIDIIATYFLDSGPAPLLWVTAGLMGTAAAATRSSWPARRSV
jgi:O-antigen ligase